MFRVVIKGAPRVGDPEALMFIGLVDKETSFNARNKGINLSLAIGKPGVCRAPEV